MQGEELLPRELPIVEHADEPDMTAGPCGAGMDCLIASCVPTSSTMPTYLWPIGIGFVTGSTPR